MMTLPNLVDERTTDSKNKISMNSVEQVELEEVFAGSLPPSVASLLYNFRQLDRREIPALGQSIEIIYQAFVRDVEDKLRREVFRYVVQEVIESRLSAESILAIVRFETNHYLVNKAVGAYLQYRRTTFEDPFAAVKTVLGLLDSGKAVNPGAVFAGLVCFGDRRVCAIVRAVRERITLEEVRGFSLATSGPLQRSTLEFCMEWLVRLMERSQYELAIQVAYGLSSMVINDTTLLVHDVEYNFGPHGFSCASVRPTIAFDELLVDLQPLMNVIAQGKLPALQRMVEILQDPTRHGLERLDQRKVSTRRVNPDRRVSDRRIVNIRPRIDRRSGQRRSGERRLGQRR